MLMDASIGYEMRRKALYGRIPVSDEMKPYMSPSRQPQVRQFKAVVCAVLQLILLSACGRTHQDPSMETASYYYTKGVQQFEKKGYPASLENFLKAASLAPDNARFLFSVARSYAALGSTNEALIWLDKTLALGSHFNVDTDVAFDRIRHLPQYQEISEHIRQLDQRVGRSSIAFRIPEKGLMPECITYDPGNKVFYLGSTYKRKVISVDERGNARDFISEGQDGLWGVFGMRVNAAQRILWVLSSVYRGMKDFDYREFGLSAAFKFDLDTGKCLARYVLDERPRHHSLNDLVLNAEGDVFITDDQANAIYRISNTTGKLELFVGLSGCTFPNGICLSADQRYLYFSHAEGASVIDIQTRQVRPLGHKAGITLCGLDGLYFYKDSLIGVQVYEPQRILQFHLGTNGHEINQVYTIEANNPFFDLPTTGVILNDTFFYIANSQLLKFSENGVIFPQEKLNDTIILKAQLPAVNSMN
jgi:tetratricopeptide (TPR) repeat protein